MFCSAWKCGSVGTLIKGIPEDLDKVRKFEKRDNIINSTQQIIKRYGESIENVYFDFDTKSLYPNEKRHSIIILRINKNKNAQN